MKHVTMVESTPDGHLGRCETCGERNTEFTGYGEASVWCDVHESSPRRSQPKTRPGLKTLENWYRERAVSMVYTPEERALWLQLAEGLAERHKHRTDVLEGQMSLFDEEREKS